MIEPSFALYGEAFSKVNDALDALITKAHVRYALVVDSKGFVLAHREALWAPKPPALDSIATLIAGNAAATSAMAKLMGEQNFTELVQQGSTIGLFITQLNDEVFLSVIYDNTTQIGKVKLFAKKAVDDIHVHLEKLQPVEAAAGAGMGFGNDFASSANSLLDDLFGGGS